MRHDGFHGIITGLELRIEDHYKIQQILEANVTGNEPKALKKVPECMKRQHSKGPKFGCCWKFQL